MGETPEGSELTGQNGGGGPGGAEGSRGGQSQGGEGILTPKETAGDTGMEAGMGPAAGHPPTPGRADEAAPTPAQKEETAPTPATAEAERDLLWQVARELLRDQPQALDRVVRALGRDDKTEF